VRVQIVLSHVRKNTCQVECSAYLPVGGRPVAGDRANPARQLDGVGNCNASRDERLRRSRARVPRSPCCGSFDRCHHSSAPARVQLGGKERVSDAHALHAGRGDAELSIIEGMNHVLKLVPADIGQQQVSYSDPARSRSAEFNHFQNDAVAVYPVLFMDPWFLLGYLRFDVGVNPTSQELDLRRSRGGSSV
jgi:hypothetical protein